MPKFREKTLVIASHNQGKIREIGELLAPFHVHVIPGNADLPEPEESGMTFAANAEIKARFFAEAMQLPALADDSGLCVEALNGAPGIYSARWTGEKKDFAHAMQKIKQEIEAKGLEAEGQKAWFICALCLCLPDGRVEHFEGRIDGMLTFPARGEKGFGYDPIFIADGMQQTFAEIAPQEKHAISHRARAFSQLVQRCFA